MFQILLFFFLFWGQGKRGGGRGEKGYLLFGNREWEGRRVVQTGTERVLWGGGVLNIFLGAELS